MSKVLKGCFPTIGTKRYSSIKELYKDNGLDTQKIDQVQRLYSEYRNSEASKNFTPGSDEDIENFKKFVEQNPKESVDNTTIETSEEEQKQVETIFEENPGLLDAVYKAVGINVDNLTPEERVKKYKEFGIKKADGTEITVEDIKQNPTFYQNNTNQSDKDYIASEKTIRDLAERIAHRIGLKVKYISDRTKKYKGKLEGDTAIINLAYATLDTPIHEVLGHPIIRALKTGNERNKQLYQNLLKELETGRGKEVLDRIKRDYVNKDFDTIENLEGTEIFKDKINDLNSKLNKIPKFPKLEDFKIEKSPKLKSAFELSVYGKDLGTIFQEKDGHFYWVRPSGKMIKIRKAGSATAAFRKVIFKTLKREFDLKYNTSELQNNISKYSKKVTVVKNAGDTSKGPYYLTNESGDNLGNYSLEELKNIIGEGNLPKYSLEEQQEEAIVQLLGEYTADRLNKVEDGKLISLLKRLLKEMKEYLKSVFNSKEVKIEDLPDNITLGDLADLLAYRDSKLILPGNEVVYTTPDNQTFKTYQEASNHISELIKLAEVNLNKPLEHRVAKSIEDVPKLFYNQAGSRIEFIDGGWVIFKNGYPRVVPDENLIVKWYNEVGGSFLKDFISKNKEYEQSKEIIEEWKKVNNIKYDPEEIYSRGQGFYSVVGAYSDFDVNLMFQNLLAHIEDNQKAGGEFTISSFTKPIGRRIKHLEGKGGSIRFKIFPKSEDIKWAANTDVYSGSVWDASKKISKSPNSELIGVSYTKAPALMNINEIQPNLANIVDKLNHYHNELGIELTENNFRLEYDDDVPYSTKKLINTINSILDEKYGKLVEPKITTSNKEVTIKQGKQPTQTFETLKEDIYSVKDRVEGPKISSPKVLKEADVKAIGGKVGGYYVSTSDGDYFTFDTLKEAEDYIEKHKNSKKYFSQAKVNLRVAALKKGYRKFPRSLTRSEVRPAMLSENNEKSVETLFQLVGNTENKLTPKQQLEEKLKREEAKKLYFNYRSSEISKNFVPGSKEDIQNFKKFIEQNSNKNNKVSKKQETPLKAVANIPQNKVSGVASYGSKVEANDEVKKVLGEHPHSIDMIEAGLRTRTTRSASEMKKYNIKVGDVIKHFGKSADGTTKTVYAVVTAIHPKGSEEWKSTWYKEGWRESDVSAINRFKDGAAAIEFKVIKNPNENQTENSTQEVKFEKKENPVDIGAKFSKDQVKADYADSMIGFGAPGSSTAKYAEKFGDKANKGHYKKGETVFISVNGRGRENQIENVEKTKREIDIAIEQGVEKFVADNEKNAMSSHNKVGEGVIREYLLSKGLKYVERGNVGFYINDTYAAEVKKTSEEAIKALKLLEAFDNDAEIENAVRILGLDSNVLYDIDSTESEDDFVNRVKKEMSTIEGLTISQMTQLVRLIYSEVARRMDTVYKDSIEKDVLLEEVKNTYNVLIAGKKAYYKNIVSSLRSLAEKEGANPQLTVLADKLEKANKVFDTIEQNWGKLEEMALERIYKYTGIRETTLEDAINLNDTVRMEKNHSKIALEENGKDTVSYKMKRMWEDIKQVDKDGNVERGFLGIPRYIGFDTVDAILRQVINAPYSVGSNYALMIKRLEENTKAFPWLKQVIDRLENGGESVKKQFAYNYNKTVLSMKFLMYSKTKNGDWKLKVFDTNSNEITRAIRQQWENNLKVTKKDEDSLVYFDNGEYKINKDVAKKLLDKFNEWKTKIIKNGGKTNVIADNELLDWLDTFGISISFETLNELRTTATPIITNRGRVNLSFDKMFANTSTSPGLFGLLANYLERIINTNNTEFEENIDNHPFNDIGGILKTLAKIESKYSSFIAPDSFRDGQKTIFGYTANKYATDTVRKLKEESPLPEEDLRTQLSRKPFNSESYLLNLLINSEVFRNKFDIDHLGITAIKELGKKIFGDNSITQLSKIDHELVKVGFFQDYEQGTLKEYADPDKTIDLRMARMFFPTMSDKSQMLTLYSAVLDLRAKNFQIDGESVVMRDELRNILYSQLVLPELKRLTNFNLKVKETNIKAYDAAAQMFHFLPKLNNLRDEETGKRVISLMKRDPVKYNMQWFEDNYKEAAKKAIDELVHNKVKEKIQVWKNAGFIDENNNVQFFDTKYFSDKRMGTTNVGTKIKLAASDFVINSLLTNANMFMLFAQDPAMYSSNSIKDFFINGQVDLPKEEFGDKVYSMISEDIIGTNIGKRLAFMIAPGNTLADSEGERYKQVFLNDALTSATHIRYVTKILDGKEISNADIAIMDEYITKKANEEEISISLKDAYKNIKEKYPNSSGYFELEGTDAQEYTTLGEAINVLWRKGELSDEQYDTIQKKIQLQKEAERKGEEIPKEAFLNYAELKLVLEPMKPVYAGTINDERFDTMRVVYVKSSSFALIPQLTEGNELDGLRRKLEEYEDKTGKFVRASYQTANKVGAVTTAITPFLADGRFNENLTLEDIDKASLTLDRSNFRIQQEFPFKSDKSTSDTATLGTQFLKLLFGDGIMDLDGFEYNGEKLTGKELQKIFGETFGKYIDLKARVLSKELITDEKGNLVNPEEAMKKLQTLLEKEAVNRNYPKQVRNALKLIPEHNSLGEVTGYEFTIPIWLMPHSDKFESLLNSIVSNRLVNIKLPGMAYVLSSEAGFRTRSDLQGINQNNIVYTSKWEGKLKAYEDGKLTQVLVPSKFRDNNGKLIEFIDKDGNNNPLYTYRDENGMLRLKEDMVDKELLNISSFRIPTSSHVSMVQAEIVGFLPTEAGNQMVVPENLTKQKGIDNDGDKEFTYHLHTYIDKEGRIKVLDDNARQEILGNKTEENFGRYGLSHAKQLTNLNDELQMKLFENEIVKIHSAVLSNPNEEVQKKINKILSIQFAKEQSELIQKKIKSNIDNTNFTILSDEYQKQKMESGAAGKMAIGVYSNYDVFNSLVQQADRPIQLKKENALGKKEAFIIRIGNQVSDGTLGNLETLAPKKVRRSKAEAFAEKQNTATDNEKEQILGKVDINEITIDMDAILASLGFDKDVADEIEELSEAQRKNGVSLPYLLLSQPIMRDYVSLIKKSRSNITEYDPNAKDKVIAALEKKYGFKFDSYNENRAKVLTGRNLYDSLTNPDKEVQKNTLELLLTLDDYAKHIGTLQTLLNINRDGLGISFFDTIEKYKAVQNVIEEYNNASSGLIIENAERLIGDYVPNNENLSDEKKQRLLEEGYIEFENYLIKPTTPVGSMLVNATYIGYHLWKKYFPYDNFYLNSTYNNIIRNLSAEDLSVQKTVELKKDIFKEFKKFVVTRNELGIFKGSPQAERQRLFLDYKDETSGELHSSLATYLNNVLREHSEYSKILSSNKLISNFTFQLNKNGVPSLIKFNNAKADDFDEEYLYMALIDLMEQNKKLPDFNGKPYTTRDLAKDLISYTYLSGGVQEAIEFVKYVPVEYLNNLPFGRIVRSWNKEDIFRNLLGTANTPEALSIFEEQYLQTHPQKLIKLDPEVNIKNKDYSGKKTGKLVQLTSFELNEEMIDARLLKKANNADYVAIYNKSIKKGLKKFQIYRNLGGKFVRVSTLGAFGMPEYVSEGGNVTSLVNNYYKAPQTNSVKPPAYEEEKTVDKIGFKNKSIKQILAEVSKEQFINEPQLSAIAGAYLKILPDNIKLKIKPLVNDNGVRVAAGLYTGGNEIFLDDLFYDVGNKEYATKILLHELTHYLTSEYIDKYVDAEGKYKVKNPPKEIQQLVILFNETAKQLGPEVAALKEKRKEHLKNDKGVSYSKEERSVIYGGYEIREFAAIVMTERDFQERMKNVKYKNTNKTLFERFAEILNNIVKRMLGNLYQEGTITTDGIKTVLEIADKSYQERTNSSSVFDRMEESNAAAEKLLNEGIEDGNINTTKKYSYAKKVEPGVAYFEVSTAADREDVEGDSRFSAFNARLKDGRTIEEAYQLDVKGYRIKGNNWRLGKSKPPIARFHIDLKPYIVNQAIKTGLANVLIPVERVKEIGIPVGRSGIIEQDGKFFQATNRSTTADGSLQIFDIRPLDLYVPYLKLWKQWAAENPELMKELAIKAKGKILTDRFANTSVSQARALSEILNENDYLNEELSAEEFKKAQEPVEEPKKKVEQQVPVKHHTNIPIDGVSMSHPIFNARKEKIAYTKDQIVALNLVANFLDNSKDNFFLLAGYAGTGKTTIAENIHNYSKSFVIAPTNAAVERLRDKFMDITNEDKFYTVHKLVYGAPDPETGEFIKPRLPEDSVLILDEASMLDEGILNDITRLAREKNTKIIFLGDSYQLEPVGKNPHLFSRFDFNGWKTELKEVKRQDNDILKVATHIRTVKKPEILNLNNEEIKVVSDIKPELIQDIKNEKDFVVLTTTNKSRMRLNDFIRKQKFGAAAKNVINNGERLIAIANVAKMNSQVFEIQDPEIVEMVPFTLNGKQYHGYLIYYKAPKHQLTTDKVFFVPDYDGPSLYSHQLMELPEFSDLPYTAESVTGSPAWDGGDIATYGYATTIHKSQGNEWDHVYITTPWMSDSWDKGKMIYTAVTRGKEKVRIANSSNIKIVDGSQYSLLENNRKFDDLLRCM